MMRPGLIATMGSARATQAAREDISPARLRRARDRGRPETSLTETVMRYEGGPGTESGNPRMVRGQSEPQMVTSAVVVQKGARIRGFDDPEELAAAVRIVYAVDSPRGQRRGPVKKPRSRPGIAANNPDVAVPGQVARTLDGPSAGCLNGER